MKLSKTLIFTGLTLLSMRCAKETIIDLPEEKPKFVAICNFKPGEPFVLYLSQSQSVFDGKPAGEVTDAEASISVNGRFWTRLRLKYDTEEKRYLWITKDEVLENQTYTLDVKPTAGDFDAITATSYTPPFFGLKPLKIDSSKIKTVTLPDGSFALRVPLELSLKFLPEKERFFAFSLRHETDVYRFDNQKFVLDHTAQEATNFTTDGRTLSLLNDISDAEPIVLVNEKFWNAADPTLRLDAIIPYTPNLKIPQTILVEWRTLSEQFYRYYLSLARQGFGLPLSDPDAVFNNIQNGYGNFSGYSDGLDTLRLPKF